MYKHRKDNILAEIESQGIKSGTRTEFTKKGDGVLLYKKHSNVRTNCRKQGHAFLLYKINTKKRRKSLNWCTISEKKSTNPMVYYIIKCRYTNTES